MFYCCKMLETFSYVQWEKMPLRVHAEIIKLFNFTVNLSEQVTISLCAACFYTHAFSVHLLPQIVCECLSNMAQHGAWKR